MLEDAFRTAHRAMTLRVPTGRALFVDLSVYDWQALSVFERVVSAMGYRSVARAARQTLNEKNIPERERARIEALA
jgi:hypothetical protein